MSDTIFTILWTATWQSTVLALFVLLLIFLLGERLAPRFRYLLWCVVLLRLAIPILPATPWGVLPNENHGEHSERAQLVVPDHRHEPLGNAPVQGTPPPLHSNAAAPLQKSFTANAAPEAAPPLLEATETTDAKSETVERPTLFAYAKTSVVLVWILGSVFFATRYFNDEIRLYRKSRYWKKVDDPTLLALFESCRKQLGIRRRVRWLSVSHGIGAASSGTFFPKVLLSREVLEQTVSEVELKKLRMVVLHELMHIKRFDPPVLRVALVLSVIHWLNPVVRLVLSRLQRERELACDAAVLHKLESNSVSEIRERVRKTYSEAVLAFASHASQQEELPGLVGLFPKHAIARRIEMILKYKKTNRIYTLLGILLVTLVCAIGLTKATEKTQSDEPTSETAANSPTVIEVTNFRTPKNQPFHIEVAKFGKKQSQLTPLQKTTPEWTFEDTFLPEKNYIFAKTANEQDGLIIAVESNDVNQPQHLTLHGGNSALVRMVQAETGKPLAGYKFRLRMFYPSPNPSVADLYSSESVEVVSDVDGDVLFKPLYHGGHYELTFLEKPNTKNPSDFRLTLEIKDFALDLQLGERRVRVDENNLVKGEMPKLSFKEPIKVPDGTPQEMLAFIQKMPHDIDQTTEGYADFRKRCVAWLEAANKGLAGNPTDKEIRTSLIYYKVSGLNETMDFGKEEHPEYESFVAELEKKPEDRELAVYARGRYLEEKLNHLRRLAKRQELDKDRFYKARDQAIAFAKENENFMQLLALDVMGIAMKLADTEKDREIAYQTAAILTTIFENAKDEFNRSLAYRMEGMLNKHWLREDGLKVLGLQFDGKPFDLAELKGKPTLVLLWRSKSNASERMLEKMQKEYTPYIEKGLQIVAVCTDRVYPEQTEPPEDISSRIASFPWKYNISEQKTREVGLPAISEYYDMFGEYLVLLDATGKILIAKDPDSADFDNGAQNGMMFGPMKYVTEELDFELKRIFP